MINIEELQSYYPDNLKSFKKNILREYLQYKILEIIYNSSHYKKLIFMGGTAIRIIHGNSRFSEDLDFDNRGLDKSGFVEISNIIKKNLELEGYNIETRTTFKNAYRCFLKINDLVYSLKLSGHRKEKIDIRLDTEPQNFNYIPNKPFINKFDIFLQIFAVPVDILLSQKIYSIINRPRSMGRDFYDAVFLLGKTSPNYKYLDEKLEINNARKLKKILLLKCRELDLNLLAKDISPFIFKPSDSDKVRFFCDYIKNFDF